MTSTSDDTPRRFTKTRPSPMKVRTMQMSNYRSHWMLELDKNPALKTVAECFEPANKPLGTTIDRVEIAKNLEGGERMRIIFKYGVRHVASPDDGTSSALLRIFLSNVLPPDHTLSTTYDVVQGELGTYARLAVIFEHKEYKE